MKPIEIHIEGYKIVISKDEPDEEEPTKEKINYISYRGIPSQVIPTSSPAEPVKPAEPAEPAEPAKPAESVGEWWRYPFATWSVDDVTFTNTTKPTRVTTVLDTTTSIAKS